MRYLEVKAAPASARNPHRSLNLLLVNIKQCRGRELEGREQFVGVAMTSSESRVTRGVLENACFDAAGQVAGSMPPSPTPTRRSHPQR
jgi:hypothetical protein